MKFRDREGRGFPWEEIRIGFGAGMRICKG